MLFGDSRQPSALCSGSCRTAGTIYFSQCLQICGHCNYPRNGYVWLEKPLQGETQDRHSEGCCYWSAFFVQSELVSIIRTHNGLRHVRGWKKIAALQEACSFSGQTLFFEPCSRMLPGLTAKSAAVICLSSSLNWMVAVGQAGRHVRALAGRWPAVGSPWALLLPSSQLKAVPTLGRQGGGVSRGGTQGDFIILCLTWQLCLFSRGIWNRSGQLSILMVSDAFWLHTGLSQPPYRDLQEGNGPLIGGTVYIRITWSHL